MPIRRVRIFPFAVAGLLLLGWSNSRADVAVFTPAKDNTLYESSTGALSNGIGSWFFSGQTNALELRRGIIAFDLSSIPVDALVQGVSLILFMDQTFVPTARTIALHRVLRDWGEGTTDAEFGEGGGGPSTPGSVTWIHTFFDTSFWVNEAGDFVATASAQTPVGAEGFPYEWTGHGLIQDVQAWEADPSLNFGWILIGEEVQTGSAKRFRAREFPDPLTVPMLTVTYLPNPVSAPPGDSATWARIKSIYR
jgi:hypothetical protein